VFVQKKLERLLVCRTPRKCRKSDRPVLKRGAARGRTVERPAGCRVVDLSKHTVTPGFIDCHVHVTMRPEDEGAIWALAPADKAVLGVQALRVLLDRGFTTARDLGIPCTPHAYGDEGIRRSVMAGVRSVEHGSLASLETLKLLEARGVFLVPTQIAVVRFARLIDDDAFWAAVNEPAHVRAKYRKHATAILKSARNLSNCGVKVALGSDFGTFPLAQSNATEFAELVNNGLSIPRALRAGTSVAAELLMRDDIGILAVGKAADIIAMPGDPFDDITVTERVEFVMKGGVITKDFR
jgi:imidazolonepropionase-like amidohydrolase